MISSSARAYLSLLSATTNVVLGSASTSSGPLGFCRGIRGPSHLRQGLLDPLLIDDEPLLIDDEDLEDAERRRLHVNAWADGVRLLITVHPLKALKRTGE